MAIYNCRSNNAKADSGYTGSASAAWSINRKPEPSDDPTTPTPGPRTPTPTPEPPIVTIYATKNVSVFGKVGTLYQIDPVGKVGKKFRSSNRKVATVTSTGLVTPKKAGKVKITFKVGKKTRRVTLTLKDPTIPTSIKLSPSGPTVGKVGDSVRLVASLPTGTNSGIKWSSSNKRVATVSNGVVVFKKPGKAVITATCVRGKKKASIKVVVTRQ